jgi:hypothetical protein
MVDITAEIPHELEFTGYPTKPYTHYVFYFFQMKIDEAKKYE